jgi:hypothetical protein
MSKTVPWYAEKETVYHDNNRCVKAQEVPATKRRQGTADRPHCNECEQLNVQAK